MLAHASDIKATPQSYREAGHSSKWEQWEIAMKEELAKMDSYKVWEVVDKLPQQRVIASTISRTNITKPTFVSTRPDRGWEQWNWVESV
jgi:hypothetical protein